VGAAGRAVQSRYAPFAPSCAAHSEHPFRKRIIVLKKSTDREVFIHFSGNGITAPLGRTGVADDSSVA